MTQTVVLIDDDEDDLEILQEGILSANPRMNCLKFKNPVEAVRFCSGRLVSAPAYIFTDINMPVMTGEEVVAALRKSGELNDCVICVLSTSIRESVEANLRALGADHVFQKPIAFEDYVATLQRIFSPGKSS